MPPPPWRVVLTAAALLMSACYSPLGVREEEVVGAVSFYGEPIGIELPDTVSADTPFSVEVTTYGGGCERVGPTEVTVEGRGALVIPFDYTTVGPGVACTDQLKWFHHEAAVTLRAAGSATVTIRGRVEPGGQIQEFPRAVWVGG